MEDDDGNCTGKSRLKWQDDVGVYTWDCPAKLIREHHALLQIWSQWKRYGMWQAGGRGEEPSLYIDIYDLLEGEHSRMRALTNGGA